jgi:flagellar basal-body rod modification protein FlgD
MTVTATPAVSSNTATNNTSSSTTASPNVDYNQFLTLLMAEIKNQDPTQPMDPTQSVTQLATISGVQQAMQTNATLSSLLTTSSLAQAEQLIGHNVTSEDGKTSGKVVSVNVTSSGSTATLADGSTISLSSGIKITS